MDIKKAERIAKRLIRKHLHSRGVWEFRFDNARRRLGCCTFKWQATSATHHAHEDGVITLSRRLTELNGEEIEGERGVPVNGVPGGLWEGFSEFPINIRYRK